jgi:hypothetical protein
MTDLSKAGGCWTGRSGRLRFRWSGAARARPGDDGLRFTVTLPAGGHHDLVLELSDRPLDREPPDPDQTWAATEQAWSDVVPNCDDLTAARDARHAYAVLRGLGIRRPPAPVPGQPAQAFVHAGMLECAVRLSAAPPGLRS